MLPLFGGPMHMLVKWDTAIKKAQTFEATAADKKAVQRVRKGFYKNVNLRMGTKARFFFFPVFVQ